VPFQCSAPSPRSCFARVDPLPLKGARVGVRHRSSPIESVQTVNA
jgi:hypothetical protein